MMNYKIENYLHLIGKYVKSHNFDMDIIGRIIEIKIYNCGVCAIIDSYMYSKENFEISHDTCSWYIVYQDKIIDKIEDKIISEEEATEIINDIINFMSPKLKEFVFNPSSMKGIINE